MVNGSSFSGVLVFTYLDLDGGVGHLLDSFIMRVIKPQKKLGFTLIELMVVVVIIAAMVALALTLFPKMMEKGKATKNIGNLRQMSPLFAAYAADNQMRLPQCKAEITLEDQTTDEYQWNEVLLAIAYPDTDPARFRTQSWWDGNDCFMRNPLFEASDTPRGWSPLNPGYGFNEMIAENLERAANNPVPSRDELHEISTPLAGINDPGRTPLVAPCDNYFFRYDSEELAGFQSGTLKNFLTNGKVPILFVDGHVETIPPSEYEERKLYLMPMVPTETD